MLGIQKSSTQLILCFDDSTIEMVANDQPSLPLILQALHDQKSDDEIRSLLGSKNILIKRHSSGLFDVDDSNNVYINGEKLPEVLSNRIMQEVGVNVASQLDSLLKFWGNCQKNPDPRAKSDLFAFLAHGSFPITPDGCFIAYRGVKRNFEGKLVDCHTCTMDNSVGVTVKMPREECDSDPNVTCSKGLHVASYDFVKTSYKVVVAVKVNPANVVAIPIDYNQQKMRTCEFEVVRILYENVSLPSTPPLTNEIQSDEEYEDDWEWDDDEYDVDDDRCPDCDELYHNCCCIDDEEDYDDCGYDDEDTVDKAMDIIKDIKQTPLQDPQPPKKSVLETLRNFFKKKD